MLRILFLIIFGFHGLIHLMGFVKAFNFAEIKELTLPISKPLGLLWLLAFMLFAVACFQYVREDAYWWITAGAGILLSQVLVIIFWQDARFGTIPNIIILLVAIVAFAQTNFNRMVSREIDEMLSLGAGNLQDTVKTEMVMQLPHPVQKWLIHSGVIGKERIYAVRLLQQAQMKMKPEQETWKEAHAVQYITIDPPAFIWSVGMQMMPLLDIAGRDKFIDGKGEMLIKIMSLIPVVHSSGNDKIDTGALQRFLGEMVLFPSAALSPYITWEEIDENSARATMAYRGTTGSGIFYFDEQGNFIRFSALRYMGGDDDATRKEWIITVNESRVKNGIHIPVKMAATWKLDTGDWTWLKIEITDIEYNTSDKY